MKKSVLLCFALVSLLTTTAKADLAFNFVWDGGAPAGGDGGSVSGGQPETASAVVSNPINTVAGTTGTFAYTISMLDLAGDSTANDSIMATFQVDSAGGNLVVQNDGDFGVTGNFAGNLNHVSESVSYSLLSFSSVLGDGGTATLTGGGYNQIRFSQLGGVESAVLSGTSADGTVTGSTVFDNTASFSIGHPDDGTDPGDTDGSSFRVGGARYRFVVTTVAIPEPSGLMLMGGIGLVGLVRRRRR